VLFFLQNVRKTNYKFGITSFLLVMITFSNRWRIIYYIKCVGKYDCFRIASRQKELAACYGLGKFSNVANSQPNDIGKLWNQKVHRQGTSKCWLSENARNSPKLKLKIETYIPCPVQQQVCSLNSVKKSAICSLLDVRFIKKNIKCLDKCKFSVLLQKHWICFSRIWYWVSTRKRFTEILDCVCHILTYQSVQKPKKKYIHFLRNDSLDKNLLT
jgi:hypothetical protein